MNRNYKNGIITSNVYWNDDENVYKVAIFEENKDYSQDYKVLFWKSTKDWNEVEKWLLNREEIFGENKFSDEWGENEKERRLDWCKSRDIALIWQTYDSEQHKLITEHKISHEDNLFLLPPDLEMNIMLLFYKMNG